jgi:hypothetical protein
MLPADVVELGARHAAAMEVVQNENEALRTVLEARGVTAVEVKGPDRPVLDDPSLG